MSLSGGKATRTPGAVPAFVGRGFAGRGSGRGVVVPPYRTEVSRFRGKGVGSRCRCSAGSDRGFEVPAGGEPRRGGALGLSTTLASLLPNERLHSGRKSIRALPYLRSWKRPVARGTPPSEFAYSITEQMRIL
jgi:hypothetical protein